MKKYLSTISLILFVSYLWCGHYGKDSVAAWKVPVSYGGDDVSTMCWIKASAEGNYLPFSSNPYDFRDVPRLAFPAKFASWGNYPMYGQAEIWLLGQVARFTDLAIACNVGLLLARITAALGFFFACRLLLRTDLSTAWVGAVVYSTTYYHSFRPIGHLFLAFTWAIPLVVAGSWRLPDLSNGVVAILGTCAGLSNPYVTSMSVIFVLLFGRSWRKWLLFTGCAAAVFLLFNLNILCHPMVIERKFFEAEMYALKPIEMFLPPMDHPLHWLADRYHKLTIIPSEAGSAYMGLVGIACLIWMMRNNAIKYLFQATTVTVFASIGGLGSLFGLFGFLMLRAGNRWSMFVVAIVLLWGCWWSYALNKYKEWVFIAAVLIASLEMACLKPVPSPAEKYNDDVALGKLLDTRCSNDVFYCFPAMPFPISPSIVNSNYTIEPYDMMRPWLHSHYTKFSAGEVRVKLDPLDVEPMGNVKAGKLSKLGFTGIIGFRKAVNGINDSIPGNKDFVILKFTP